MSTRVVLDAAAIASLKDDPQIKDALQKLGEQVAERAAQGAPRRTGEGAASITAEVGEDAKGAYVRVSWDRDHFYMYFHEVGTSKMSARPFLRPALDGSYNL